MFWVRIKGVIFCLIFTFYFLYPKANVVMNIKTLISVNKSISLIVTSDSVSLNCSLGLKEFKISTLKDLHNLYKNEIFFIFAFFIIFLSSKNFTFSGFTIWRNSWISISSWLEVCKNLSVLQTCFICGTRKKRIKKLLFIQSIR